MNITREELLVHLAERATGRPESTQIGLADIGWVMDELEEMGLLVFDSPLKVEPMPLGTVVSAATRHDGKRQYWTKFTNIERAHSAHRWINDRGQTNCWADLVNPRPTREP